MKHWRILLLPGSPKGVFHSNTIISDQKVMISRYKVNLLTVFIPKPQTVAHSNPWAELHSSELTWVDKEGVHREVRQRTKLIYDPGHPIAKPRKPKSSQGKSYEWKERAWKGEKT